MEIIKLGGSVITNKEKPMTPNLNSIFRLSREISSAKPKELIIIHGGGSFGHPLAKEYLISEGYVQKKQLIGYSLTHQSMVKLNTIIVEALLDSGVPAVSVAPSSFITTTKKRITQIDISIILNYLKMGMIPVLYGDTILDSEMGFTILSGDQLAVRLAIELKANRLIFGVDVDGVYSTNPKIDNKAEFFNEFSLSQLNNNQISGSSETDVTGGMLGKIMEAENAVKTGINVVLLNALKVGLIYQVLKGESVKGTILRR
ncbi:isopentenyl phosphate kinase family protein [Candidatus Bathyarchaeota archaeon]|nr:isopentenyl phosphate kinase family protein [Candidatus Bathyarchaeota archaeon]